MLNRTIQFAILPGLFVWATLHASIQAQEPRGQSSKPAISSQESSEARKAEKLDFFRERLEKLRLGAVNAKDKPFHFVAEPLLTFENPVSQMLDGYMFVWTNRSRPAAAMKCYYHAGNKRWGRTFVSLASEPIELSSADKALWTPREAGLSFQALPRAVQPADDSRRRLTQMRDMARRFEMVDQWGLKDPTDWQLRLLPQPLYRYESPEDGVIDGAMFGYVVNSPEAVVLIELRKDKGGTSWHYAVARFTRFAVTVSLDGKQIAAYPRLEAWPPTGLYFHDPVEIPDYPFETSESQKKK